MTRVYLLLYIGSMNLGSNTKTPRKCVVQGSVLGLCLGTHGEPGYGQPRRGCWEPSCIG
jgi:hypothetical protein